MSGHRVIVFRTWHSDDGRQVPPNILTGHPRCGTPRWNVDCVTCGRSLGAYATEEEARQIGCTRPTRVENPSTHDLPENVAVARRMWLAGYHGAEIAAELGISPRYAREIASGHSPAAHRLDAEQRASVARLHAEAVKIRGRAAA